MTRPVPVLPLNAYPPRPDARPGLLKAIGVSGIIVAVLSIIASLGAAGYAAGAFLYSNSIRDRILSNAPTKLPVSSPDQPVMNLAPLVTERGEHGFEAAQRQAIIAALAPKAGLAPQQVRQLDALLAEAGEEIFGLRPGESIRADAAVAAIGDNFGTLATASAEAAEPVFFITPGGKMEVHANRALFYKKNSARIVRVAAGRHLNSTGHPILLPRDVDAMIDLLRQLTGSAIAPAQIDSLRGLLSDPKQELVCLIDTPDGEAIGLQSAIVRGDGYAQIEFAGGPLLLSPSGRAILKSDQASIPGVSQAAGLLVVLEAMASIGLAVFLLFCSVRLLRDARRRLRPQLIWAAVKICLALCAGLAMAWLTWSLLQTKAAQQPGATPSSIAAISTGILVTVIGCIFPIAILIVSRARSVRAYYAAQR